MNGGFREFGYVAHSSRRAAETAVGPRREAQTGAAPMPERKGRPRRQGRQNVENPKFEGKIYDRCRDKDETTSFLLWDPFLGAWDPVWGLYYFMVPNWVTTKQRHAAGRTLHEGDGQGGG